METSSEINEIAGALASFQSEVPTIEKGKTAGTGNFSYKYADIADVLTGIRSTLSKNGLSVSQSAENEIVTENNSSINYIVVTTMVMHKSGQWLRSSLRGDLRANQGKMSNMQAIGSITTYLRRYSIASMLGIATDEDVDGNLGGSGGESNAQIETENYRNSANAKISKISHADVVSWCNDYTKRNRSLECMKKIDNIAGWQLVIDSKISETVNAIQYLDDDSAAKADESLKKIQDSRVQCIESNVSYDKVNALYDRIKEKVESENG